MFTAMAAADFSADLVGHGPDGRMLLTASAAALLSAAGVHTWWAHRGRHPSADAADAATGATAATGMAAGAATSPVTGSAESAGQAPGPGDRPADGQSALWRMRTTVADAPGSLGRVCTALAASRVDIVTLQTHPLAEGTVDEFLLRAPAALPAAALVLTVADAGGRDTWLERADAHDMVDAPTRMLTLATRTALDAAELPLALRQLFGRCTIRSTPATPGAEPAEDALESTEMRLRDPSGGTITVRRDYLPFTPTEFARARALVELDARLGVRMPGGVNVVTLPGGNEITVRRAGPEDRAAALAMHDRCSPATLAMRYHGPAADADRYLTHLLGPRFGRSLAVETASGRLVALGHLLWDGDENEVALLVEDAWQRRGIGGALLRRLVELAAEAGRESVYAVTQAGNTGMVAAMRELGLPLDYQVEDATLVITASLPTAEGADAPSVDALPWVTSRRR
ncbi:Acetyltransferase (GNAT) family protein [Actinacidiphila rubida]|uniref:Acetyltransferase (GNAT) family protein n=1 Tax=Actinacidiphila rubida TaxID=310780 RepID=A0A1H8NFI8_9ACTN|nr:Acetyltransferase (GNAT) family protein [Actinacidiphila rubida]